MNRKHWLVLLCMGIFITACKKDNPLKQEIEQFLGFHKPDNFPDPTYHFATNPVTKAGFELGRALFYEPRLSRNNTISCGSCHIQSSAFTQHGHDVSHGIDDRLGTRNSPPIMNLAWNKAFMWGGGVYDLDLQPVTPITAHEEMDESLENVYSKLRDMPKYQQLFRSAFGSAEINTAVFMKALSQFMVMCISSNSRYDKIMRKEAGASFTSAELNGYHLFKEKCASCHAEPLFTDGAFRNNGLGISPVNDLGLYTATLIETDKYKFKVPSLRNLTYTGPYMHDGRFLSLPGVLEHYNSEVQPTPNLDPLLRQNGRVGIPLSGDDQKNLLAFLKTLDDEEFIKNISLSEQ
ncbi:cytochrome C peroxidase [Pedobacter antarcticus 4BY]|uniref:Cytochrome C peroxidase n=2 Tax=Pedobacter antarcticus TaxID=34086 RepID=A0A081PI14_9SPHI|nr:cytochrome c peroxidase [Pedobacter antarcticus]KEQ30337.1 cytochrome C peroxidase [Pedobacter antarcticus 4BY]SFE73712.1 cytochrome c peroxidase [Pedobacter antarcticus]